MKILQSIRSRLLLWYGFTFSVVLGGLGLFLYYELETIVIGAVDNHLHSEVQLIANLLKKDMDLELSEVGSGDYSVPLSGHYYQVTLDGRVVARSPSLSLVDAYLPIPTPTFEPLYSTDTGPGRERIRVLTQSFQVGKEVFTIQASESMEDSYVILNSFRRFLLVLFPSLILAMGVIIWTISGHGLRRLIHLSRRIEGISERNLGERLDEEGFDRELRPLVRGFNTMLSRLEEAFEKQKEFFSNASHTLRTPISIIRSYCDVILSRKRRRNEEYREALLQISKVASEMARRVDQILDLSRLDSSDFLKSSNVDLLAVAQDVVRLLTPFALEKGVTINLDGKRVKVEGNEERLLEALTNIVDNSIKYNRRGGSVDIRVDSRDGWAILTIADTGKGIERKDRVFERFYREDADDRGSGLGLSIAKAIIDRHGGRIEVTSKPGRGSRFTIFLPSSPSIEG